MNIVKKIIYNDIVPTAGLLLKSKNQYINVIYYHDIVKGKGDKSQHTNIEIFKSHIDYIADNGYKTYTFDDLENGADISFQPKSVLITFDDGWLSNYTEIFDYMKSKNIKYNIFLAVGEINNKPESLTWAQIREMHESGIVGFGAHTYSHISMKDINTVDLNKEIDDANQKIFDEIGVVPVDFCYPYGQYSVGSDDYLINNSVYKRIYTSDLAFSYEKNGKIVFGRSSINNDESFKVFKNKLNGNYNAFKMIRGK